MVKERKVAVIIAVILILVGVISFVALSKTFSNPETFKGTIQVLDDKKNTVAKMSALSIAAASAIDLIPGDAGSSISKALVNLGGYFVLLFAAIYLEKLLITMGGYVAFKILIPIGLFLIAGFMLSKKEYLKALGTKLITVGLVLFLLVPSSVMVSDMVDKTHDISKQQAIEEIGEEIDLVEPEQDSAVSEIEESASVENEQKDNNAEDEDASFFDRIKRGGSSAVSKIKEGGTAVIGKVKDGGSTVLASAKEVPKKMNILLNNLIEEVAYFFVSICVIPLIVMVLLIVFLKQILGFKGSGSGDYTALVKTLREKISERKEAIE